MIVLSLTSAQEQRDEQENIFLDNCLSKIANCKDSEALSKLYEKTSSGVYALALSILKNTHDAQDVLHDCYIKIFMHAAKYKSNNKPMAWIITIAKNLCLQKLRNKKNHAQVPLEDWDAYFTHNPLVSEDDRHVLCACMAQLTDEERQIIVLYAVSGFKHREIAQILGINLSTVLSKYNRSLKKLKILLTKGDEQS